MHMLKNKTKRLVSFLVVIVLIFSLFSTVANAFYTNYKKIDTKELKSNFKEKLENIKEKTQNLKNRLNILQYSSDEQSTETKYSSFYKALSLFSVLRTTGLTFYTNYAGMEKNYNLKIFKTIKIDVNNDSVNDFSVRAMIYPGIEFPLSFSFNMKLVINSLGGYDSLDENAFFQSYAEFYRPGILFKESEGDGICFGYESPIDGKIPENIELLYKFIPNLFAVRKTPVHKLQTDLKSEESKLSILFSYTSLENETIETEHNLKILYEPLKKSSISFGRTGSSSIEFKRDDSTSSYVTLFYEKRQDTNSTFFYAKDVPSHITFTADISREYGLIEFDTHGEAAEEIGMVDDFENPQNSVYFTNLFSKAGINWHRDRFLFIKKGVANCSVYSDGQDVGVHVYLTGSDEGFVDFEAFSHQALNCSFELNFDQGYLRLLRSSVDLSLFINVEIKNETLGNFVNKLQGSCDIKKGFDGPFEILFDNLKSGAGQINLAGKSLDISNLLLTGSSPVIGGNFTVSMEKLVKEKEGRISFDLSIEQKDNNITGSCCFRVENGVKITELSLLYNDFEFHRENIDVAGDIVRWYNFSFNVTVEWHVHKDWGYVLVKSGGFASFSFNSMYTNETGVLTGLISGIISFKVINEDFNISWRKIDGNYTFSFDGSGVASLKDFDLWIKDKIDVSIPELSVSFEIDTDAKEGSLKLYLDDNIISGEVNIENINITDVFDITLKCSINAVLDVSASGFIEMNWNESGITSINGDFGADVSGSIDVTDFVFKYNTLVDISMDRLFINGDLNFDFSSTEGNMSIYADVDITDIIIDDLSIYASVSAPFAVSANMSITFNGEGYVTLVYSNDTIILDGAIYDDSDIVINSLWLLIPGLYIEINLESFSINGPMTVLFNVDSSKDIPFMITVISEKEVTADTIYLGYPGIIQIHIYDFVGGDSGGRLGIGLNTATSQPVFDFNHSSCFIGDLQIVLMGVVLIPISNLSLSGTAHLEGFLDLAAFTYVYLKGVVLEETTITCSNVVIPFLNLPVDLSNFSLVLKPGYIDLLLQNTGDIYLYGYSSSWITIKADDKELLKFIGTLNLFMSYSFSDDGSISLILDAKEISAEVIVADSLRFAGEINAHIDFSININNSGDTTTISDLYINVSGKVSAVVQVKGNDTDWIPIIPFNTSGQVVLLCQTALMKAPEITSDFITETDDDNKTLRFEVWYAPPLGEDSSSIGPYTYNVSFGDGTYYEVITNDNRIVTEPHFYNLGVHTASVTVTPSDSSIDPIYDVLSFEIVKNEVTYLELVDSGPLKFTYADVEGDGRIHTWFSFRNKAEENYLIEWEAGVFPYDEDFDFEELDPIVEPETGFLNPGEEQRVNVSIYLPSDHRDHIGQIYPSALNLNYTGTHPVDDSVGMGSLDIRQSFSLFPKGGMYLPSLGPGESKISSFWIINNKANALNWTISDISNQNYSLPKTEGMIPPGGAEIVYFTVNSPSEEGADLASKIEVTDLDDPLNIDTLSVIVGIQRPSSSDSNVTISEDENGNVSIAIGGSNEIHINNFVFEINGVSGAINGDFIFDTQDSYVFINWTKGDLSNFSVDGNAEFSIENFAFSYGENISIVVSRVITGGLHCSEGRKGNFTLVVDDTFVDVDIDVHFNNIYSNFNFSGNIDIDIDSVTDGTLVISWDLEAETKDISIDGDLLHTSNMNVLISDFVLQFNNFTLNAGLLYFNRTVFVSWNETSLTMEGGSTIQAEDIYFSLNGDSQLITIDANIKIDGYVTFEFKPWNDGFMFCINATGFTVNGWIYIEFGEYYGSAHIFWKIVGWFCIGLETS
jgi:hypothetical protein